MEGAKSLSCMGLIQIPGLLRHSESHYCFFIHSSKNLRWICITPRAHKQPSDRVQSAGSPVSLWMSGAVHRNVFGTHSGRRVLPTFRMDSHCSASRTPSSLREDRPCSAMRNSSDSGRSARRLRALLNVRRARLSVTQQLVTGPCRPRCHCQATVSARF
jgi:hypothetical protein